MNKNGKVVQMSSDTPIQNKSDLEQQKWMNEHPTREEVTQFVSAYVNNEVIPIVLNSVGKELFQLRCRNEILLKMLIESEICTAEEFESSYKKYLAEQTEEVRKHKEAQMKQQESKIIVPDKKIIH